MSAEHVLSGKVALVTGAASGIGAAAAAQLAGLGALVVGVDKDERRLALMVGELASAGHRLDAITCDLSDAGQVATLVPEAVRRHGGLDVLVNAAGIDRRGTFLDADLESFRLVHEINLVAPFVLIQAAGVHMRAQGRGGKIVSLSSASAFRARQAPPAYASAKLGLVALTRSAAADFGAFGVNVNAVAPGITDTPMLRSSVGDGDELLATIVADGPGANLMHRVSLPGDVASVVVFLCTDAARDITGQVIHTSIGAVL